MFCLLLVSIKKEKSSLFHCLLFSVFFCLFHLLVLCCLPYQYITVFFVKRLFLPSVFFEGRYMSPLPVIYQVFIFIISFVSHNLSKCPCLPSPFVYCLCQQNFQFCELPSCVLIQYNMYACGW